MRHDELSTFAAVNYDELPPAIETPQYKLSSAVNAIDKPHFVYWS